MSEAPNEHSPVQQQEDVAPSSNAQQADTSAAVTKRPAENEIEFISSNPVKKRKLSGQQTTLMGPMAPMAPMAQMAQMAQAPMPPPPRPPQQSLILMQKGPGASQFAPIDRRRSLCGIAQAKGTTPSPMLETRGVSLPVLENFAFPLSFPPILAQRPRLSEAISPKQLPQILPEPLEAGSQANQARPPSPTPTPLPSITLDQISCLDFNGIPTSTPGFDVNRIFSTDGGLMSSVGVADMSFAIPPPSLSTNPFTSPNAIPFRMYSTGSLVPMMPPQGTGQPPTSFSSLPVPQPQQQAVPAPIASNGANVQGHHHPTNRQHPQAPPPFGSPAFSRPSSPAPGQEPPCLHCARIRQQTLLRQSQGLPPLPAPGNNNTTPRQQPQQHACHPPPATPASSTHLPPLHPTQPCRPAPRSSLAPPERQRLQPPVTPTSVMPLIPARASLNTHHHHIHAPGPPPNLVQDIVQTVQSTFPYAQVAARHGVLPARVAEVLAGVVVGPLLRGVGRGGGMG